MVKNKRSRISTLFLMELILAILFFSLCSAICVQFFVKSHLMSQESQILNAAVDACSGAAEVVKSADSLDEAGQLLQKLYPDAIVNDGDEDGGEKNNGDLHICVWCDDALSPCRESEAVYLLSIRLSLEDRLLRGEIGVTSADGKDVVYELTADHYLKRRASHER